MMDSSKSVEEKSCDSCKRQENGDGSTESERPLKKARFAWQVKGRYHLKNETSESRGLNTQEANYTGSSENDSEASEITGNAEQNLEILGDYLLKQDFNTLDSITESESLPSTSISNEKLSYPRYITSDINETINDSVVNQNASSVLDLTLDHSKNSIEDLCIARWQARQMAKCFVDNTINRVLDNWMIAPLPADIANNRFLAFDVAEFINNLPGDNNSIENEGILMAISAHGLQNTSNSSSRSLGYSVRNSNSHKNYLPSPSYLSEDDIDNLVGNTDIEGASNEMEVSWLSSENKQTDESPLSLAFFPDGSSSSYQSFNDTENISNSNECCISYNDNDINNHYDFMDAAVSFAIQYKGLTSLGTDG